MTKQRHLKDRVRARMLKTGESYTAARRRVVARRSETDTPTKSYALRGGTHPETAALSNTLANAGVASEGKPLTEELILGIGGGLGAGYILWQFKGHPPVVTLGFRNRWQYPDRWLLEACSRLGIEPTVHETSGHVTAMRTLREALSTEGPRPLVWIDAQEIGYWHLPERFSGMAGYPVVVIEEGGGRFLIDDRNSAPLSVDESTLQAARGRVPSYRNRLVTFPSPAEIPMRIVVEAIESGLEDQVRHLGSGSDSFSLPAWRKWARLVTDTKNKKGWGSVFADQRGLFGVLLSIYESVESSGFGGGSLRGMYTAFLDTAADVSARPSLGRVAALYRDLDEQWAGLADRVAPRDVEPFGIARGLIDRLHEQVLDGGDAEAPEAQITAKEMWRLRDARDGAPLLDEKAFEALLLELGDDIYALYEAERRAAAELGAAIER